jgi:malonyl-CoA O-methyltransferase
VRDAEDATFSEKFSLITSNAALQWFEDLREAIVRQAEMLEPGGRIYFSIFGPRTFEELSNAWAACWPSSTLPSVGFLPLEGIAKILQRCFLVSQTREEIYQEIFPTLKDLLRKIKYTGVRGPVLNGQGVLWPGKLKAIEQAYLERYKQIIVTYQVFFCQGAKG